MSLSRRGFLGRSAVAGAGIAFVGSTEVLLAPGAFAAPRDNQDDQDDERRGRPSFGYGPLVPDPAGRLALPAGFSYQIVSQAGVTKLESGHFTPSNHDGTGAFDRAGGGSVLVNNHELRGKLADWPLPVPHIEGYVYDPGVAGGCTVVEADRHGRRIREYVGVAGTSTNCAGGRTPWETWLTCEETEDLAGQNGATKDHGYVFEVEPYDKHANRDPKPIKALGRYAHEAVAVDPRRGHLYLTEDAGNPNGLLYRWEPPRGFRHGRGRLKGLADDAGTLAAMHCLDAAGNHVDDLSRATEIGTTYQVKWVPVPERDARKTAVRKQFTNSDVTRGRKLEGIAWNETGVYVVTSFARAESPVAHDGQVWYYDPARQRITLKLRYGVNPNPAVDGAFDSPDNITVSPHGGVILAEDGEGIQHLVGAASNGRSYPLARNDVNMGTPEKPEYSEFTGPTFSSDEKILFANVQEPGTMFAITGPWRHHAEL
ncbi:alkaline phosphatase PhoX [Yinghuangia seranimata]|uniref:alkaline phosphatase PhoX n=1 Tax=Yinghuangia seranimata TaxID=408067 RepID=UPI00248A9FFA|nr:alkaline phosphatase PhoX [Yinghuangia seranimata]MDI2128940.1 DUF839 domain-containing protein [Yinghuangia seranimata]